MDLEVIILIEVSQRQMYDITYVESKKNDTDELTYKIEIDSEKQKTNLW